MIGFHRLLKQFIGRALLRQKLRALVAVVGVALGVAVMVAIRLANVSVIESFRAAVDSVSAGVSLRIFPQAGPFPEELLRELRWLPSHGRVSPVLENYAMVISPDSPSPDDELLARNELLYVLGVDILRDLPVRRYQLLQLDQEAEQPTARELLRLLVDDDAIILTEQFARRTGYRLGETITLAFGSRQQELTIRGFLRDEGPARTLQGNFALMDLAAAQLVSDRLGELDYLDLQLESESQIETTRQTLSDRLPAPLMVEEPRDQAGRTETMIAAFQFNLTALSSVALLVGLFLIYNMVSVSVAARRSEIGMLRALGAGRLTIMGLFLGEALLLAGLGLLVGLPLGTWLAQAAVVATSQTVETFYIATIAESTARETALSWRDALSFSLATLTLAMLAALLPAWNAATTDPIQVIRGQAPTASLAGRRRWLGQLALLLLLAGWGLTRVPPVNGQPIFGFLAQLLFLLSAACCTPFVLEWCCRLARRCLAAWSPAWKMEWRLAGANLQAGIPQTSVSVAALAMSLGMMIAIGIMVGSFRQTVSYWLDSVLTADIMVKPVMNSSALLTGSIDADTLEILESDPDVLATCWYSSRQIPYDSGAIRLDTTELKPFLTHGRILFKTPGPIRESIFQALEQSSDFVLVSESFSLRYGKQAGDSLTLPTPTGPRTKKILAVYFDYASNQGTILLDFAQYKRDFQDQSAARAPLGVSLHLRPGADPETTRQRLLDKLGPQRSIYVVTNDRVRREALSIFESTFAITYVLQSIAILIAGTSVVTTLVRLIHERQREIGLLSLLGASRRQIQTMIVLEATMIGAVSQLLGIAVGIILSVVLIYVINVQSFGWTIQFHLPLLFLLQSTGAIVLAAALFGLYPARKASGMDALSTVRDT